jgi:acetolactate synthase-1/2/3 large subunit
LNIRQVSYNWASFARFATKIQVDIDAWELQKPLVKPDLPIHCDVKLFLGEMSKQLCESYGFNPTHAKWLSHACRWKARYPVVQSKQRVPGPPLNTYDFFDRLFDMLGPDDAIVCGNATACVVPFQTARLQHGQRLISNSGAASMGYDLPAAIGAAIARGARTICLAGDGSLQMNVQELQTVVGYRLPIKLFVLNNNGYLSIRQTQKGFFQGRRIGESPESGVTFPVMAKIGTAYGIPSFTIKSVSDLDVVKRELESDGPTLFDVHLDPDQEFEPRLRSRIDADGKILTPNLEDMYPFLPQDELASNMLVEDCK